MNIRFFNFHENDKDFLYGHLVINLMTLYLIVVILIDKDSPTGEALAVGVLERHVERGVPYW